MSAPLLVEHFIAENAHQSPPQPPLLSTAWDIQTRSGLPWLPLKMPFLMPLDGMLREARALHECFVPYRPREHHNGWKSLCLHGISSVHTDSPEAYGMESDQVNYSWTDISTLCPITYSCLRRLGYKSFGRVRFMLLEAGGYILPHVRGRHHRLDTILIPLNQPDGCEYIVEGCGKVPFHTANAFLMDNSWLHAVWNRSSQDRYHLAVHGLRDPGLWNNIISSSYPPL